MLYTNHHRLTAVTASKAKGSTQHRLVFHSYSDISRGRDALLHEIIQKSRLLPSGSTILLGLGVPPGSFASSQKVGRKPTEDHMQALGPYWAGVFFPLSPSFGQKLRSHDSTLL